MGSPPPQDYPPSVSADASLDFPPGPTATICGYSLALPRFKFGLSLFIKLPFAFPPAIPFPFLAFKLSCDPSNPVDITAGLKQPFGGGRTYNAPPDPDLDDVSQ
jgi:hypothetical protein